MLRFAITSLLLSIVSIPCSPQTNPGGTSQAKPSSTAQDTASQDAKSSKQSNESSKQDKNATTGASASADSAPPEPDRTRASCIHGTVSAGQMPVPGAIVTLQDVTLGVEVTTRTGADGGYSFCSLMAGEYALSARRDNGGMSSQTTGTKTINLGKKQTSELDLVLK